MKKQMTKDAARRIQSAEARKNNGIVRKNSFAAKAMRQAALNEPKGDNL